MSDLLQRLWEAEMTESNYARIRLWKEARSEIESLRRGPSAPPARMSGDAVACITLALDRGAARDELVRLLSDASAVIESMDAEITDTKRRRNDEQRLRLAAEANVQSLRGQLLEHAETCTESAYPITNALEILRRVCAESVNGRNVLDGISKSVADQVRAALGKSSS